MKTKIILSYSFLGFILLIFYLGLSNSPQYETKNLVGQKIPKFELKLLSSEKVISTADLKKNKFTLINFWASWCGPCRVEHKYLMLLSENKNLKILGVNFKDNKNNALNFLNKLGDPYSIVAKDIHGKVSVTFGVYGIPESVLINRDLEVIKKFIGPISNNDYKIILKILKK
tara:strand:- start:24 stop:539 length:516 start_codon:yes stop_codon:yes gene_type:complete